MTSSCEDSIYCRTTWNIVLSSLTTTFVCTWLAVHPNVSEPIDMRNMSFWKRRLHATRIFVLERIPIFILVIVSPEFILSWAIRQRMVAGLHARSKNFGMTRKHQFLILMGGFHYFTESGNPHSPLERFRVEGLISGGRLDLPKEEEIEDKSKANALIKLFAFTQSFWFLLQCITRSLGSMRVTKLEILTIAYMAVNFSLWLAWLDKPMNLGRPFRVHIKYLPAQRAVPKNENYAERFNDMILGIQDYNEELLNMKQVPLFYSGRPSNSQRFMAIIIALLIGGAFAGINCIAWSYESSSFTEVVLWRLSSLAIFGLLFWGCMSYILDIFWGDNAFFDSLVTHLWPLFGVLYVIARILSVVLAFIELRNLPPEGYRTFYWLNLVPHV